MGATRVEEIEEGLNEEQLEAVEHEEGPLLVVAGAGTGKTRVITHRIARLIEKGVNPSSILALTFTDRAAAEMEERVDRLVPYGYSTVWISTFHSFGDRILRDNALEIGLVPDFRVLTEVECVIFLREHLYELPLEFYRPLGEPARYLSELVRFIGRLKDEDISPEEYLSYCETLKDSDKPADYIERQFELARTYAKYEELLKKHGYIDFGDEILLVLRLFRERPSVLRRYQERFVHILADEFQDTNYAQFELLKLLAGERKNITVVADDDQSIYKFRGAAVSNVIGFLKHFPEARLITLKKNYRSVQPILDASYRLITHNNPDRLEVKSGIDKRLLSVKGAQRGGGVKFLEFDSLLAEADFIARTIEEKVKEGSRRLKDFAILVRANRDAEPFLRALSQRGIEYQFSGSKGLYSREEIMLLISFLRVITDRDDNVSLFHLASSPVYGLGAEELVPYHNIARRRNRSLFKVLEGVLEGVYPGADELTEEAKERIRRIVEDVKRYSELALREPTGRLLYMFLTESSYLTELVRENTPSAEQKVRNIEKFFNEITHIEDTLRIKKVHMLREHLDLLMEAGSDPSTAEPDIDSDYVHVLTVHKAKGLEFPVVFMVGLVVDRFPRRARKELLEVPAELIKDILPEGDYQLEEERRLFYVGMTRAMEELYLTTSRDWGGSRPKKPSPFVLEALDTPQAERIKLPSLETIKRFAPVDEKGPVVATDKGELHLSYYQVDDYLTCPLKYRYVHILRVPILPHHTIMYGKAIHDAISFYFRKRLEGIDVKEEELIHIMRSAWRSEGFISREHEEERWKKGVETIRRFLESDASKIMPACVEREFSVAFERYTIRGRWDLIEEREDGAYIIDFKTSDVREPDKATRRARESIQLRIYALSYLKHFGRMPAGCELHFLETGLVGVARFTEKDMAKTIEKIDTVAAGIERRDFSARPGYMSCGYCPFNRICPDRETL